MDISKCSNHSKYVVLTDHSSGKLVGNYSTYNKAEVLCIYSPSVFEIESY